MVETNSSINLTIDFDSSPLRHLDIWGCCVSSFLANSTSDLHPNNRLIRSTRFSFSLFDVKNLPFQSEGDLHDNAFYRLTQRALCEQQQQKSLPL
jgi:hypothetical protein